MLSLGGKVNLSYLLMHTASAFLGVFLFFCIVFAANLLRIPFYLDYKWFQMDITVLTPFVDRVLWIVSGLAFSTLLFASPLKKGLKGLHAVSTVLFVLVVAASAFALLPSSNDVGTAALLIAGLVFSSFSILRRKFVFGSRKNMIVLVILYGILVLFLVEAASLVRWVYYVFSPSPVFGDESWNIAFAEAQISSILYPVLPAILIIFSFSWVGELVIKGFSAKDKDLGETHKGNYVELKSKSFRLSLLVILASVVAALFMGYYRFAAAGTFNGAFPGTDVPFYTQDLKEMLSLGVFNALTAASKVDRFLYLVFQYSCFPGLGLSPEFFVVFVMPVLLTLLLMFSSFIFVRSGQSLLHAATAMLVTAFSFTVTVGVYAGFLANWFALSLVYGFYGLLVTILNGRRNPFLLSLSGIVSVALLFTHPWTWALLIVALLGIYLLMTTILAWRQKNSIRSYSWELKFIIILLAVNILMFYVRQFLLKGGGGGLTGGYTDVATPNIGLLNVFQLRYSLEYTLDWCLGGFYAYAPMMLLAILGVFSITNYEDRYNRILLTWILIGSSMAFVGTAPGGLPLQARFLFDMPINIYAALGISYSSEMLYRFVDSTEMRRLAPLVFWTFYLLSTLFLFNYTVRCMVFKQLGGSGLT
jgi:hypothetical protein